MTRHQGRRARYRDHWSVRARPDWCRQSTFESVTSMDVVKLPITLAESVCKESVENLNQSAPTRHLASDRSGSADTEPHTCITP